MSNSMSKYTLTSILLLFAGGGLSALLQLICGNFPVDLFRFPLNLIIMAVWLYALVELYRSRKKSVIARYLLSSEATILSIGLLVLSCAMMGLQRQPSTTSYPFILAIFYMLTQLSMVIMRGWRNATGVRWRFVCNHVGLWLAVGAGFWGAPDMEVLRTAIDTEQPTQIAYHMNGSTTTLNYDVQLIDFRAEYYDNQTPSSYEADVAIAGEKVTLSVNRPHTINLIEDIYLTAYDSDETGFYCIVQIVKQPFKWVMATGIILLMAGAVMMFLQGYKTKLS